MTQLNIADYIDHTLLKPDTTADMIDKLCQEARDHHFFAVCVNAYWVARVKQQLRGSNVKIAAVVGFPLGATTSETKAFETVQAVENGTDEIDMVINIGALKDKDDEAVRRDIMGVVHSAGGNTVKVIIETGLLTEEEKERACRLSKEAGAHFVKTSTGFGHGGATVADVELMRRTVGPDMGVKASGGVRDCAAAEAMIKAGATRIGTSGGVSIVSGGTVAKGQY